MFQPFLHHLHASVPNNTGVPPTSPGTHPTPRPQTRLKLGAFLSRTIFWGGFVWYRVLFSVQHGIPELLMEAVDSVRTSHLRPVRTRRKSALPCAWSGATCSSSRRSGRPHSMCERPARLIRNFCYLYPVGRPGDVLLGAPPGRFEATRSAAATEPGNQRANYCLGQSGMLALL